MDSNTRPIESPVKARFDLEFFNRIPESSGLYWFTGTRSQTLYIGKSRNLRRHLLSFREVNPEVHSSYLFELLRQVSNIFWLPIDNELQIFAIEKQRIESENPIYNRPDPLSRESRIYFGHSWMEKGLVFGIHRHLTELPFSRVYGGFKKPVFTHRALTSFLRLLWTVCQGRSTSEGPSPLLRIMAPTSGHIDLTSQGQSWRPRVHSFFEGQSDQLIFDFKEELFVRMNNRLDSFCRNFLKADLEQISSFYQTGPSRNFKARQHRPLSYNQINNEWPSPLLNE